MDGAASTPPDSKVAAWQLLDGPTGWSARSTAAQELRATLDAAAERVRRAEEQEALARNELARLRARRSVRLTQAVAVTGRQEPVRTLPGRLRAAARPQPAPPAPDEVTTERGDDGAAPAAHTAAATSATPPRSADARPAAGETDHDRDRLPELRILHLGALCRFGALAQHTPLRPEDWRRQLRDGGDLLLLEPPPLAAGWDPLGELAAVLRVASELGIPTVRIHVSERDGTAPGRADLELVEGVEGDLPPSIDHTAYHPRGWTPAPPDAVCVLLAGPPDATGRRLLERFDPPPVVIHPPDVPRQLDSRDRSPSAASPARVGRALRRAGVLLDAAGWRQGPDDRVRSWLAAQACGTPVVTLRDIPDLVPTPGVLAVDAEDAVDAVHRLLVDADARERLGIVGRRHALTTGSRRRALVAILDHLGLAAPAPPAVTVLLSTHRPEQLTHALEQVERQSYDPVEVSLVLHGDRFDALDLPGRGPRIAHVTRAPAHWRLGECLNAGLEHADGALVAKMDDDDHYGAHHLEDLVIAWRHSGADIVGKRIEYIHLADRDLTLRRAPSRPERDRPHVGGPTLLGARGTLRRFGFLRLPNRVDSTLYERVLAAGGRVYGTHSRDVVLSRRGAGHGHAWDVEESQLLTQAVAQRPGLDLDLADSAPPRQV